MILAFFPFHLTAQQKNIPSQRDFDINAEVFLKSLNGGIHTGFKPYLERDINQAYGGDICGVYRYNIPMMIVSHDFNKGADTSYTNIYTNKYDSAYTPSKSWLHRKIKTENLFIVKDTSDKFILTIDPLFNFEFGKDLEDSSGEKLYKNTRGILVRGDIGSQFSFESSFLENQATFVQYIDDYIIGTDTLFPNDINYQYRVIPGQGRSKTFKLNGYDYGFASGYVSYSPGEHFNFQLGHGKHFVGDGYRSLLLSDNAFNYPYLRITTSFGRLQYTNLYTVFMNLTDGGVTTPPFTERLFQKKAASFQFLSLNLHKSVQLGFFQGLIWQASDARNEMRLDASYFNPLIFVSAVQYGLDGAHNVVLGSTLKIKIANTLSLYGQYLADDLSKDGRGSLHNKTGFQAGLKYFDLFTIKNLHLQLEYNQVRPYTYAHKKTSQNYSHYNQPLAHPAGTNFREAAAILNYRIGDFFSEIRYVSRQAGRDSAGAHFGGNIFSSDNTAFYGYNSTVNDQNQGLRLNVSYLDLRLGYLVNPVTNLNLVLGASLRTASLAGAENQSAFIYVGFRTSLANYYYDF
ncbi:MAG: hypothetical protein AB1458_09495 [Bacteroidota bacterium]